MTPRGGRGDKRVEGNDPRPRDETVGLVESESGGSDSSAPGAFGRAQIPHFLATRRNAVLATWRKEGSPSVSPVWYLWDGSTFRISSPSWTAKVQNIRMNPNISLCIDDAEAGCYVSAHGVASIIEGERVRDETWPLLLKYLHEDEAAVRWVRLTRNNTRVLILLKPDRLMWGGGFR
jgi:PPOX class probable F420-dependent enzyme